MIPNDIKITPELIASHGLKPDEYDRILELIGVRNVRGELQQSRAIDIVQFGHAWIFHHLRRSRRPPASRYGLFGPNRSP